jgi:hypothetical protein
MPDIRAWILGLGLLACEAEPTEVPGPSYAVFRNEVYPVLLRDCGFVQCHGDADRFFVLHGPGRSRLDPDSEIFEPPTEDESWLAYQSTRGMLANDGDVFDSPLLTKPLEGHRHDGLDRFGRNVWQIDDSAAELVARWAAGTP